MAKKLKDEAGKRYTGVHAEVLKSLASSCGAIKSEMDEARGELGAKIKDAEETHGVHRQAFKLALKLRNMEDAPRADFLRALEDYIEKLGLNAQGDLFDDGTDDERDAGDGAEDGDDFDRAAPPQPDVLKDIKAGIKPLN